MQVIKSYVDSLGHEFSFETTRVDKFFYDNDGNLTKREIFEKQPDGKFMLISENYHQYDNKPNYLKKLKQIDFSLDQSIPCMFSKNNLLHIHYELPGKLAAEIPFEVAYDGDLLKDYGMDLSDMKWACD